MEKPDWLRWHARKVATLPECVCLSLDAEPYPINLAQPPRLSREREPTKTESQPSKQAAQLAAPVVVAGMWMCNESAADKAQRMLNSHPALQTPEAAARYARLRAHFLDEHPLLPGAGVAEMGRREEAVTVYDFAKWANAAGWELPRELDLRAGKDPIGAAEASYASDQPGPQTEHSGQDIPVTAPEMPLEHELRRTKVKRAALKQLESVWPTVGNDLNHANRNGLADAAKSPDYGLWWEEAALHWARVNGRLRNAPVASLLHDLPRRTNRLR